MKILIILFTIFLYGCSGLPLPPPKYQPISTGIIDENTEKSLSTKVQGGPHRNLAIILSENSKESIKYLEKIKVGSIQRAKDYPSHKESFLLSAKVYDPELFIKYITNSLKNKFNKVTLFQNISEINKNNYSAIAIIDIYRVNDGNLFQTTYISNINTAFYDVDKKHIGTIGSSIQETIKYSYANPNSNLTSDEEDNHAHRINLESLQKWESELEKIIEFPKPITQKFNYDNCIRQAISVTDKTLKSQAMDFCEQQKKAAH